MKKDTGSILEDGYYVSPKAQALITLMPSKDDGAKQIEQAPDDTSSSDWSNWGDNNLFPQAVLADLDKNTIAHRALDKRRRVHFGRGIVPYRETTWDEEKGEFKREIVRDKEVSEWFRINQVNRQWSEMILGLEIFANEWIEFITNKTQDKINRAYIKDPSYCRISKMNTHGRIENLFYSARWETSPSADSDYVSKIPFYDPEKYDGKKYQDPKFAYPLFYRSFNRSYYHRAIWDGVRSSGWMNIANKVPALKLAIMKNQMTLKYHVQIPQDYFDQKYPSPSYTKAKREEEAKKLMNEIEEFLTDVENSGKSLFTFRFYDQVTKSMKEGWKIDVIDNKLKDDAYLPDSQAANSEILFAIGLDPCMIGSGIPGGKLGAGSGSDKREAYWMLNADMGPDRVITLEPLYFIRDFNKWDSEIKFDYITVDTSQTQDKHPSKTEKRIDQTAD